MKTLALSFASACVLMLSACASTPTTSQQAITSAVITGAETLANSIEVSSHASASQIMATQDAETTLNAAWTSYQNAVAAGQSPSQADVAAALAALENVVVAMDQPKPSS